LATLKPIGRIPSPPGWRSAGQALQAVRGDLEPALRLEVMTEGWTVRPEPFRELAEVIAKIAAARADAVPAEIIPSAEDLALMADAALWATTQPDEGRYPRFTLLFSPPELCRGAITIPEVPLTPANVARLAPALKTGITQIGVRRAESGPLTIWGLFAGHTTSVEVSGTEPGRVVVRLLYNLAVVQRNTVHLLVRRDQEAGLHGLGRGHIAAILGESAATTQERARRTVAGVLLLMIVDVIREQRHGGTLLVMPHSKHPSRRWLDSGRATRLHPGLRPHLGRLLAALPAGKDPWEAMPEVPDLYNYLVGRPDRVDSKLIGATTAVGVLAAVDGALVLTQSLRLVTFGATIREPQPPLTTAKLDWIVRRPILDYSQPKQQGVVAKIETLGGTRRQSAARFVANNYDTIALTASHDGPLSLAAWVLKEPGIDMPRPHLMTGLEDFLD